MMQWQRLTPRLVVVAIARLGGHWHWLTGRVGPPPDNGFRPPAEPAHRLMSGLVRRRRPF